MDRELRPDDMIRMRLRCEQCEELKKQKEKFHNIFNNGFGISQVERDLSYDSYKNCLERMNNCYKCGGIGYIEEWVPLFKFKKEEEKKE
ncbi:MAG: hypothetical protein WC476_01440 [Phycisphaerae bacterium]|jgi:hypothetical protein